LSSSALAPMRWRINAGGCQLGPRTITRDRSKPSTGGLFIAMVIPKLRFLFFGGAVIATRVPGGPTARSNSPVSEFDTAPRRRKTIRNDWVYGSTYTQATPTGFAKQPGSSQFYKAFIIGVLLFPLLPSRTVLGAEYVTAGPLFYEFGLTLTEGRRTEVL